MTSKSRMLWQMTRGSRRRYAAAIAAMVLATLVSYLVPLVIGTTIDSIFGDKPLKGPEWFLSLIALAGGKSMLARNLWLCGLSVVVLTAVSGVLMSAGSEWPVPKEYHSVSWDKRGALLTPREASPA